MADAAVSRVIGRRPRDVDTIAEDADRIFGQGLLRSMRHRQSQCSGPGDWAQGWGGVEAAARLADVVLLGTPYGAAADALREAGDLRARS